MLALNRRVLVGNLGSPVPCLPASPASPALPAKAVSSIPVDDILSPAAPPSKLQVLSNLLEIS